jgi:hypothetical protein
LHARLSRLHSQSVLHTRNDLRAVDTAHALAQRVRRGELVRVAAGLYADGLDLTGYPEESHALRVRAHAQRCEHVVPHVSAVVLHGLPVPAADLSEVHFSRPGSSGNDLVGDRRLHAGCPGDEWLSDVDGIRTTNLARSLVDLARTQPMLAAVAAIDAALYRGETDPAELVRAFEAEHRWRGSTFARNALKAADGRAESPTETWARLAVAELAPGHELQFEVYDEHGTFVGRADGGFPLLGVIWEYDGQGKYEELRPPGVTKEQVLAAQMLRQGAMARLGWCVVRGASDVLADKEGFRREVGSAVDLSRRPGWRPPRGSFVCPPPVRVEVRDPIQWAAAQREERYERWQRRKARLNWSGSWA